MKFAKIYIIIFLIGLTWATCSDILISGLENHISYFYVDALRVINNLILFGITAIFLYKIIRKQQYLLRISAKQYRSLFKSNPNPMWVFNRETLVFIEVNDAAIAKYGYQRKEFLSKTMLDIRPVEEHERLKETLKHKNYTTRDEGIWKHIKKSGNILYVSIASHNIQFNGQPCKMVMVTDMTEIVQSEAKLLDAYEKEKALNIALQEISWSNSHEMRRPVASVLGLIGLLKDTATEEERKQCLAMLESSSVELDQIVRDINQKISVLHLDEERW